MSRSVLAAVGAYCRLNFVAIYLKACTFRGNSPRSAIRFSAGDVESTLPPYDGDGIELDLHLEQYFGENPKGTKTEQAAAHTWAYAHTTAVPGGPWTGQAG